MLKTVRQYQIISPTRAKWATRLIIKDTTTIAGTPGVMGGFFK
jgi:hypothetical protein